MTQEICRLQSCVGCGNRKAETSLLANFSNLACLNIVKSLNFSAQKERIDTKVRFSTGDLKQGTNGEHTLVET